MIVLCFFNLMSEEVKETKKNEIVIYNNYDNYDYENSTNSKMRVPLLKYRQNVTEFMIWPNCYYSPSEHIHKTSQWDFVL